MSEYSPRLMGYIRSMVKTREDAEDILQDVFYQLARTSADDETEIGHISAWLYRVARNSVLNFWRKKREVSIETEDTVCEEIAQTLFCSPQDAPDTIYLRQLVWQELDMALAELPPGTERGFLPHGIRRYARQGDLCNHRHPGRDPDITQTLRCQISAQTLSRAL